MYFALLIIGMLVFFAGCTLHEGYRIKKGRRPSLFRNFWQNTRNSFRGKMLLLQLAAVICTLPFFLTPLDTIIQHWFQRETPLGMFLPRFLLMTGNFWHLFLGLGMWAWAAVAKQERLRLAAFAGLQALMTNAIVNTLLKFLSGRRGPANIYGNHHLKTPFIKTTDPTDFDFAFWNHTFRDGRFFWPSGHTASVFAFVTALTVFYPEKKWIPVIGYPAAVFTALCMISGDFHWTSDTIAGALGGIAMGLTCGTYFRNRFRQPVPDNQHS